MLYNPADWLLITIDQSRIPPGLLYSALILRVLHHPNWLPMCNKSVSMSVAESSSEAMVAGGRVRLWLSNASTAARTDAANLTGLPLLER